MPPYTMATCFDRWEKDPFFPAAEEVQESTDRMESVYRRWIRERNDGMNPSDDGDVVSGDLRQELHTALGTAKWQLEELDRTVTLNDDACSAGQDTRARHNQFVEAIGSHILNVENSLKKSNVEEGKDAMSWVRLDDVERDELAVFLSASLPPLPKREKMAAVMHSGELEVQKVPLEMNGKDNSDSFKNKRHGHRRTMSANADIEAWKILVSNEDDQPYLPPQKTPSFSCLTKVLESTPKMKLPKNGFRKWKGSDQRQEEETIPLHNQHITQGFNECYERSKSYLSSCNDESYDKQLYGWGGMLYRQLQRSQYQIQCRRPIQMILWTIVVVFLIGCLDPRRGWQLQPATPMTDALLREGAPSAGISLHYLYCELFKEARVIFRL